MASKKIEKVYEIGFHIIPTLSEKESEKVFSQVCDLIAREGEVISKDEPKRIPLQYTIRHNVRREDGRYDRYDEAYFGSVKFRAVPDYATAVEKDIRLNEQLLRFLLIETIADDTRVNPEALSDEEKPGRKQD